MSLRKTADDHHPRPSPGSLGPVPVAVWPLEIACPVCEAPKRTACAWARGTNDRPHSQRVAAARKAGHAPKRGRPALLDGDAGKVSFRLGDSERAAIDAYLDEHPDAKTSEAIRAILAEWLEDRT